MYIRAKHHQGRTYYAVVRSEQEGGKHSTLESAINELEARIETAHLVVEQCQTRFNSPQRVAEAKRRVEELTYRLETLRALQNRMQRRSVPTDPTISNA